MHVRSSLCGFSSFFSSGQFGRREFRTSGSVTANRSTEADHESTDHKQTPQPNLQRKRDQQEEERPRQCDGALFSSCLGRKRPGPWTMPLPKILFLFWACVGCAGRKKHPYENQKAGENGAQRRRAKKDARPFFFSFFCDRRGRRVAGGESRTISSRSRQTTSLFLFVRTRGARSGRRTWKKKEEKREEKTSRRWVLRWRCGRGRTKVDAAPWKRATLRARSTRDTSRRLVRQDPLLRSFFFFLSLVSCGAVPLDGFVLALLGRAADRTPAQPAQGIGRVTARTRAQERGPFAYCALCLKRGGGGQKPAAREHVWADRRVKR